jgi:hypothetical protein
VLACWSVCTSSTGADLRLCPDAGRRWDAMHVAFASGTCACWQSCELALTLLSTPTQTLTHWCMCPLLCLGGAGVWEEAAGLDPGAGGNGAASGFVAQQLFASTDWKAQQQRTARVATGGRCAVSWQGQQVAMSA